MDEKEFLQQIEELRANEEFVAKIKEAQTVEDFVQAHRDAGFDIDASDIEAIKMPEETGDLSEEDLENVAGGGAGLVLLGYGIKYFWDMTPGDNARQKTKWLADWYKTHVFKKKKK